jgi:hypothetical protein
VYDTRWCGSLVSPFSPSRRRRVVANCRGATIEGLAFGQRLGRSEGLCGALRLKRRRALTGAGFAIGPLRKDTAAFAGKGSTTWGDVHNIPQPDYGLNSGRQRALQHPNLELPEPGDSKEVLCRTSLLSLPP